MSFHWELSSIEKFFLGLILALCHPLLQPEEMTFYCIESITKLCPDVTWSVDTALMMVTSRWSDRCHNILLMDNNKSTPDKNNQKHSQHQHSPRCSVSVVKYNRKKKIISCSVCEQLYC